MPSLSQVLLLVTIGIAVSYASNTNTTELTEEPFDLNSTETLKDASQVIPTEAMQYENKCATDIETEYYGTSYREVIAQDPGECCAFCQNDINCQVWTYRWFFSNRKGKVCWLMKDAILVKAVRDVRVMYSGIRDTQKPVVKNIVYEDGFDYPKEKDLYKIKMKTVEACAEYCKRMLLCKAFTFHKTKKMCYGKPGTAGKKQAAKMVSAVVV